LTQATLGKWGKNLAIRLPLEVVKATGLRTGEKVEVEARGGDIIIRRAGVDAAADARAAAEEIIRESENYTLDGITIRELIDEGRR
jgi:antitoxin component of MazEF toxin-antitoxin module